MSETAYATTPSGEAANPEEADERFILRPRPRRGKPRQARFRRPEKEEKTFTLQNIAIALFPVMAIGCYYPDLVKVVWVGYAIGLAALAQNIFQAGGIRVNRAPFLGMCVLFAAYCFLSITWAYNPGWASDQALRMVRGMAIGMLVCPLIRTRRQFQIALFWMAITGLVFAGLYLSFVDWGKLATARLSHSLKSNVGELPNYNVVAMYLSFSSIYFLGRVVSNSRMKTPERILTYVLLVAGVALIVLFGSRKSILAIVLAFFLFLFAGSSGNRKAQLIILVAVAGSLVLAFIPAQYLNYVIERLLQLGGNSGALDHADMLRISLFEHGLRYISEYPLFGCGYYNFSELMGRDTGYYFYAHNNFIEVWADLGIVGVALYYGIYAAILHQLWKRRKTNPAVMMTLVLLAVDIFNGFFIVYVGDSYVWTLLGILYAGARGFGNDAHTKRLELEASISRRRLRELKRERKLRASKLKEREDRRQRELENHASRMQEGGQND